MIDHLKVYSLRKVENQVAHGGQIWHNSDTGNNRVFIIGAQVREQRRQAALIHGEDSEKVRRIGRETMKIYRSEGDDFRRFGTKPEFNGYDVKSNWKIVSYEEADKNESVLELTGDRTGNTIDEDLKFHFSRFEGNAEQAVKDVANYRYYFKLASVKGDPKVQMATHRNSKRFWDECRAEEQRLLENELLEQEANIEIPIPSNNTEMPSLVKDEESSDNESCASMDTVVDVSLEVHADDAQNVSFSKSFSDDALSSKVIFFDPTSHDLKQCIVDDAPQAQGILSSQLILGKVINQAKDSVVVRRRSRIPSNIMNPFNSSSSSLSNNTSSQTTAAAAVSQETAAAAVSQETAAAASNEAQMINSSETTFPPPHPMFCTPPAQPTLVIAPTSVNFEFSEAPTLTPPTPFADVNLGKVKDLIKEVEIIDEMFQEFKAARGSPPKMMSLAEPEFKSINIDAEDVWSDSKEEMQAQLEEYHEGAEIDAKTIEKLTNDNRRQRKLRSDLYNQVNTLRVAGSAMAFIINDALAKFETPRFDMDLRVSESHSSTKRNPRISMTARKSNKSDCNCLLTPKCDPSSSLRCTHCELQWAASVMSVIWNDAMRSADLSDAEFLIDHYNPRTANGPPPDYFSKVGEISLTEQQKQPIKRGHVTSPTQNASSRRRIDSEEILSADDSLEGRESLEVKREVVEQYRTESAEMSVSELDEDDWTRIAVPEFIELPVSDNDE